MVIDNKSLYILGLAIMGMLLITTMLLLSDNSCKELRSYMNSSECYKAEQSGMVQSCIIWTDR